MSDLGDISLGYSIIVTTFYFIKGDLIMRTSKDEFVVDNLQDYILNPDRYVYPFVIKEKNGKERTIITYNKFGNYGVRLRAIHEAIIKSFKINFADRNVNSFAYHKNVRCYDALESHMKSNVFIKLDIHHFFESITEELFFSIYGDYFNEAWRKNIKGLFYKGALSIGFVSSPEISDFFMKKFDADIEEYLQDKPELHYSRYSDDILLSSELEDDLSLNELFEFVKKELGLFKLEINEKKTRKITLDYDKHNSISYLGLNLSKSDYVSNKITISKRYILFILFLIEKQRGYSDHCYPLDNEIKSRVAYLAYNSPISYQRFQKKHMNRYGEPYHFTPKELDKRSAARVAKEIPDFEEYSKLFRINIHKKVANPNKDGFAINDAIELEKYLGRDQEVVEIPYFIDSIGKEAFAYASKVKKVVLNEKLKNIEAKAFAYCSNLEEINLPKSLRFIGESAFTSCYSLKKIVIPPKVTKISANLFERCRALEEVTLGESVKTIMTSAFKNTDIKEINFPESLKEIQTWAFYGCDKLVKTNLATSQVEQIGPSAFEECSLIKEAILPNTLLTLASSAFKGCNSLRKAYIPASVLEIGTLPFVNCPLLESVEVDKDNKIYLHRDDNLAIVDVNGNLSFTLKGKIDNDVKTIGYGVFSNSFVKNVVIPEGVTSIAARAFEDAKWLQSISLPSSLETLGEGVFKGCISLKEIVLPENIKKIPTRLFSDCINLKSVKMSEDVEVVGDYAFNNCQALEFDLPKNLRIIGAYAFANCLKFKDLYIPAKVKQIKRDAFKGLSRVFETIKVDPLNTTFGSGEDSNVIYNVKKGIILIGCQNSKIDQGIRVINKYAFAYCPGLKEVKLPNTVQVIGKAAFVRCENLEKVELNIVNKIEASAFALCANLKEIVLPDSLTSIGDNAFVGTGIKKLVLPESITSFGKNTFAACDSLEEIKLPSTFTYPDLRNGCFSKCFNLKHIEINLKTQEFDPSFQCDALITKSGTLVLASAFTVIHGNVKSIVTSAFVGNKKIESVYIPETVEHIEPGAFANCSSLKKIEIEAKLDAVPPSLCSGCESLEEVILPSTIENIGRDAFFECKKLKAITLPDGLQEIGSRAFADTSLESIKLPNGLLKIGSSAFSNCFGIKSVKLPSSLCLLGDSAFANTSLESITIPNKVEAIPNQVFARCKKLKKINLGKVKTIGRAAFNWCESLKEVVMSRELILIGSSAFKGCGALISINLPDTIQTLETECFRECSALESVNFPEGLLAIGDSAFRGCQKLVVPPLPASLNTLQEYAFADNPSIKKLFIPKGLTCFDNTAFIGCNINAIKVDKENPIFKDEGSDVITTVEKKEEKEEKILVLGCKNSVIPDGVTIISTSAFAKAGKLKHFRLPASLKMISSHAFGEDNLGISEIVLPDKLEAIGEFAFGECSAINNLKLNNGLKSIGFSAFPSAKLKKLYIPTSLESLNGVYKYDEIEVEKGNKVYTSVDNKVLIKGRTITVTLSGAELPPVELFDTISSSCFEEREFDKLIIPDGVVNLSGFGHCKINELHLPKSIKNISSFAYRSTIKKIFVDKENPYFCTDKDNKMLLDISKRRLYYYCGSNIVIPEGITAIEYGQLKRKNVKKIALPSSYISSSLPLDIDYLTEATIAEDNPYYESIDNAIVRKSDKALMFITRPAKIPEGVERIASGAFGSSAEKYDEIFIPKTVKFIEMNAFYSSYLPGAIIVDKDNPVFDSRNNCNAIIVSDSNVLIAKSKKTVVPDGVTLSLSMIERETSTLARKEYPSAHFYQKRKDLGSGDPILFTSDGDLPF